MAKFSKEVTVESLFCNEVAPEKMVLQGMKDLEAALKSNFQESQSFRQRQEALFRGSAVGLQCRDPSDRSGGCRVFFRFHPDSNRVGG